ncbi:MAG: transcription-repair-coupling factor [Planctomycetota bacterium]|nr:MAG: transcription-repair-coupling factor [Planctomycetota bacterium]
MSATAEALRVARFTLARSPALQRALDTGLSPRRGLGGVWTGATALVVAEAARGRGRCVVLASTPESAESLLLDLRSACPELLSIMLPADETGMVGAPEARANHSERLVALASLDDPRDGVLVVPAACVLEDLPASRGEELVLAKGEAVDRERLLEQLADAGFERVPLVAAPGEFSLRGDILDVYPWSAEEPVRLELFDDEIEELRAFEVESQRSSRPLLELRIALDDGRGELRKLVDMLSEDTVVFRLEPPRLRDRLVEVAFERGHEPKYLDAQLERLAAHPGLDLYALDLGEDEHDLGLRSVLQDTHTPAERLAAWLADDRQVCVLCDAEGERERLHVDLRGHDLPSRCPADGEPAEGELVLLVGRLSSGFALPAPGPVVVHHHELLGRRAVRRRRAPRKVASRALESLAELKQGDYVVHLAHGVARYQGMRRLEREQGEEDFLVLEFAEETTLYVPASRIDLVERFIGGEASSPKLDKIGGRTWARKKDKVARAVEDLAAELLRVQAARDGGEGIGFPGDDPLLARFERTFPYEDTPDQHTVWGEVRKDMERGHPMDRLVVGDVGFGKTEIAVRAAYQAVLAGRQVAVLVPTTILAEQHDETFRGRMTEEPVRIETLSRLRGKGSTKVLADAAEARVDILIGTHKLLGKGVKLPQLGLVIVDEEQRFGVAHKERLKQLRASVDVLTLSATPIPRTLHMAMSGLRDISTIRTPPPGRQPVITKVTYESDEIIQRAIRHELDRGGQVFVLHNRVGSIVRTLEHIRGLVPRARASFAHGQMGARELSNVIADFSRGDLDVLVCTTIVESGVDIPRANTIIVTDSQNYGLADMHQLRGRVGRESTQAYAFFLVPRGGIKQKAEERLKAIEEFSSLDAGLTIALRDLELRGAGNLLGAEQSGHILAVGYDMYCRLLRAAVARAKGQAPEEEPGELEVDLGLAAYLPTDYVPEESVRMNLLRRMAKAGRRKLEALAEELVDRFGPLPDPVSELLDLFRLRRMLRLAGVGSLISDGIGGMVIEVRDEEAFGDRHPFRTAELFPITPTRLRVPWPTEVATPTRRLRYLLERFGKPRSASRPRATARRR